MEDNKDFIQKELQKFNLTDTKIAKFKNDFMPIVVNDFDDKENYNKAREARLIIKNDRVSIEKKRKELKENALRFGQAIDKEAKRITAELIIIENHLQIQEDIVGKHKERLEEEARIKAEQEKIERERVIEEERIAKEREIEEEKLKLAQERLKIEADKKAIEEAKEAIELEKQRQIEIEQARKIAEEYAVEEKKKRIEVEKQKQIEIKQAKIEAEKKAIFETEQRLKKEIEEKERKIKEEEEYKQKVIEKQKRKEANLPDKKKLTNFILKLQSIELPEVKSKDAKEALKSIETSLNILFKDSQNKIDCL